MKKAILYIKHDNKIVQCQACSHYCAIREGMAGICGVRRNIEGKLYLLVYGKPAAVHVDPIEKKPLYHFLPGTDILSIGTYGCNFRCGFCQNYELSGMGKEGRGTGESEFERLLDKTEEWSPERLVDYALENKIPSIAYTYNEPAIFVEYARDIMVLARENGIKNVYVSNGFESKEALDYVGDYLDAANIDLKSFSDHFYRKICGGRLQPVLDTIKRMHDRRIHLEITTLIIPGENDSKEELKKIAEFIANVDKKIPWHLSRFFPMYKMKDHGVTPVSTLAMAKEIGKDAGLTNVYVGNV
ncbi:MAG: AmmeMemoRadiSam system radical SAM enzyme [Patescibacteria group bacterium]